MKQDPAAKTRIKIRVGGKRTGKGHTSKIIALKERAYGWNSNVKKEMNCEKGPLEFFGGGHKFFGERR